MSIVGDLGGVHELFFSVTSSGYAYISFHSFILKALKKMYLGSTEDKDLFVSKKTKKFKTMKAKPPKYIESSSHLNHYPIKLSRCNSIRLFLLNRFCCLCCCKKGRNGRLMRLFEQGEERLNTDFSIDRIVKA